MKNNVAKMEHSSILLVAAISRHLSPNRRLQIGILLIAMLMNGIAELISLGAILPFLAVLADPAWLFKQEFIRKAAFLSGIEKPDSLLIPTAIIFSAAACFSVGIRLCNLWLNGRIASTVGTDLSCEAYRRILAQPYEFHVNTNSSKIIAAMTAHISRTVSALAYFLQLLTALVVATALLLGLLIIDARVALSSAIIFGTIYTILGSVSRRKLIANSRQISDASNWQLKLLQEALGAIRDVILDGSQMLYVNIYKKADQQLRQPEASNQFLSVFPRYSLEASVIISMAAFGTFIVSKQGPGGPTIPLLGALALGAQRLLPVLQQIYVSWASLKGFNSDIKSVLKMLDLPAAPTTLETAEPMTIRNEILLDSVCFNYKQDSVQVLSNISFKINRGERVGLVGETGSGKSTLVDLLMGLLSPVKGGIYVDGVNIHDTKHNDCLQNWRAGIAHVPQSIYLIDGTIAENIAFGVSNESINIDRVMQAACQAKIDEYIVSLPEGYWSEIGERGTKLSGGQKQRIGIARALYKKASLLILDEATSALDEVTEKSVMNSIEMLNSNITVVIIAHRLSTLEQCDRIIRLKKGVVVDQGPPDKILYSK